MKIKNLFFIVLLLVGSLSLISCDRTSIDEDIEDAAERTGAAVKDIGEATGDAIEDATD